MRSCEVYHYFEISILRLQLFISIADQLLSKTTILIGPATTTQKSKLQTQTSKKSNDSEASKKNRSKESPKESERSAVDKSGNEVIITDASEEGQEDTSGGSSRHSRPDQPGSGEKRDQTPDTSVMPTHRGVSTPTG